MRLGFARETRIQHHTVGAVQARGVLGADQQGRCIRRRGEVKPHDLSLLKLVTQKQLVFHNADGIKRNKRHLYVGVTASKKGPLQNSTWMG